MRKDSLKPPATRLVVASIGVLAFAQDVLKEHIRDAEGMCVGCNEKADDLTGARVEFPCDAVKLARQVVALVDSSKRR